MSTEQATVERTGKPAKKYQFRLMVGSFHEAEWVTIYRNPDGTDLVIHDGEKHVDLEGKDLKVAGNRFDRGADYRANNNPAQKLTFEERFPLIETNIDLMTRYNRPNSQKFTPASRFLGQDLNTEEGIQQEMSRLQERLELIRVEKVNTPQQVGVPVSDGLDTMNSKELREYAEAEGIELAGSLRSKEQIVDAIRGARAIANT